MSTRTLFILIYGSFLLAIILPAFADYFSRRAPRKEGNEMMTPNKQLDGLDSDLAAAGQMIESLRQQLAEARACLERNREVLVEAHDAIDKLETLKNELKQINHALNDPRVDLTITASEAITELRQQLAAYKGELK